MKKFNSFLNQDIRAESLCQTSLIFECPEDEYPEDVEETKMSLFRCQVLIRIYSEPKFLCSKSID